MSKSQIQPYLTQPKTVEVSNVAWGQGRPVQVSWASPRRMLQESPSREVSCIFSGLETHGVKATLRECYGKINSMSEGQQPLRGPFLRHFLGNPEVRSDQNKKTWPLAVLWPRIPRFAAASYLTGLSKLQSDSPDHKILTELTLNIISKYTYSYT